VLSASVTDRRTAGRTDRIAIASDSDLLNIVARRLKVNNTNSDNNTTLHYCHIRIPHVAVAARGYDQMDIGSRVTQPGASGAVVTSLLTSRPVIRDYPFTSPTALAKAPETAAAASASA